MIGATAPTLHYNNIQYSMLHILPMTLSFDDSAVSYRYSCADHYNRNEPATLRRREFHTHERTFKGNTFWFSVETWLCDMYRG